MRRATEDNMYTESFNENLGNRFIAYRRASKYKNAEIVYIDSLDVYAISGVTTSKVPKLVDSFVKALKLSGESILFKTSDEGVCSGVINNLEYLFV